jgi:hypothetical protein
MISSWSKKILPVSAPEKLEKWPAEAGDGEEQKEETSGV